MGAVTAAAAAPVRCSLRCLAALTAAPIFSSSPPCCPPHPPPLAPLYCAALQIVVALQVVANVAIVVTDELTPAAETWFT